MNNRVLAIFAAIIGITSLNCEVPKPGHGLSKTELIQLSKTIALVKLRTKTPKEDQSCFYEFDVVKHMKGAKDNNFNFYSHYSDMSTQSDFNFHTDSSFWQKDTGRSAWPCCICGPDHVFEEGTLYLYFPDQLGSAMSAEVVTDTTKDLWYQFVINELNSK